MVCAIEIADFPTNLGCLIEDGYIGTIFRKTKYLGGKLLLTNLPIVDVTLSIFEKANEEEFLRWWREDLKNGTMPFYINMKFFGAMHDLEFRFISNINEVLKNGYSNNPIKLELLNIQGALIRHKYNYELICDEMISCDDELICT